jgi:flagellar M-ring protein FliF
MKATWEQMKEQLTVMWSGRSKKQKIFYLVVTLLLLMLIITLSIITSTTKFVPLYSNLSMEETGQIKAELDQRNIPYEIKDGGTTIHVPVEQSEQLLVDFAGEGIPHSGNIDYSFFSENISWGMTDNEFNILKLDAMQTELANLIKGIEGIEDAKVMITQPPASVFVSEEEKVASASIVLHTNLGYEFKGNQMTTLYHLVSKAIPNLPEENIVIMNQYFEYFDQIPNEMNSFNSDYEQQQEIKNHIEHDIQRRLQQMLGAMVGLDHVIVSVTADIDFTKENRVEEIVEPVDIDNMEGIPVSIETIRETFEGDQAAGGVAGTGEGDIPNYPATTSGEGDGNYQLAKETVNYELNRIHKEIAETPYKIRDLGIQVVLDNAQNVEGNDVQVLSERDQNMVQDGIESILNSMIATSIDKEYGEIDPTEKVSIVFQAFKNKESTPQEEVSQIPTWVYILGLILLIAILLIVVLLFKKRKTNDMEEEGVSLGIPESFDIPDLNDQPRSETDIQREHLEKLAKDKPEEFAKLLRSWIHDE